jgi:putative RNA 2'-phosphotransferase
VTDSRISKRLSYWLRHAPEAGGLQLDGGGWALTERILEALRKSKLPTSMASLEVLVASSDKQRFELSEDGTRIRARQGHSVKVDGDWPVTAPPPCLFHGTTDRFLPSIMRQGLLRGGRHHVHLSSTIEAAEAVGARRGRPVVLSVAALSMAQAGFTFRLSSNGVWLTDGVPPTYLRKLQQF